MYTVHEQTTIPIACNLASYMYNMNSLSLKTNLCDGAEMRLVLEPNVA